MSYTTGFVSDVVPFDEFVAPRRNVRPIALGATAVGCGIMAVALVMASMAVTSAVLDALDANADMRAEEKAAPKPAVLAKTPAKAPAAATVRASAPAAIAPGRSHDAIADARLATPPAVFASLSPAPLPPVPAPAMAAPPAAAPSLVPLPPSRSAVLPSTTPRTAPPPPVVASTSVSVSPPGTAPAPSVASATEPSVPLPPRRPAGSFEIASAPRAEMSPPATVRPEMSPPATVRPEAPVVARPAPVDTKPPAGETKVQKSAAATDASAQPDNRNFFQRLFGSLGGPSAPSGGGPRAAVYDIAAHTVYMPNGERLEAHSGLGAHFDDPRSIAQKMQGVTPPNTYQLSLREKLFHGVPALRLTPTNESSMYGRVGMLAHTYMLGARGDSNGCVSFRDYNRFLQAYKNGEVTQLVVVTSGGGGGVSVASARAERDLR